MENSINYYITSKFTESILDTYESSKNKSVQKNNNKQNKVLKIDKRLPQVIIPEDKVQMFINWWNSDIRFEKSIPQTFDEGYVIIDNLQNGFKDIEYHKNLIKTIAGIFKTTYRNIENQFKAFLCNSQHITLYFKFTSENSMVVETYGGDNIIISNMEFAVGENSEPEKPIEPQGKMPFETFDDLIAKMNFDNLGILISCLWYIATTTKSTRYIYENKTPVITGRNKGVVQVSDTKFITTPIYDMRRIKTVKVEKLTQRKKGWTYSHSFEVHGHYRHYRNGKVVFIKPFIKGKNKEFKAQTIIVKPENNIDNNTII